MTQKLCAVGMRNAKPRNHLNHISALEIQKKKREEGMGLIRLQNTVQVRFSNEISQGECQKRCETGED